MLKRAKRTVSRSGGGPLGHSDLGPAAAVRETAGSRALGALVVFPAVTRHLQHPAEVGAQVLELDAELSGRACRISNAPQGHLLLLERLLLVEVHHVRQQDPDVEAALGLGAGHGAQDVEPGGHAVGRRLVEHGVGLARRDPEAHGRQLDAHLGGVERDLHHLALLGHVESAHLEDDGQREDGRVDELEARAGAFLIFGDRGTDGLGGQRARGGKAGEGADCEASAADRPPERNVVDLGRAHRASLRDHQQVEGPRVAPGRQFGRAGQVDPHLQVVAPAAQGVGVGDRSA